MTESLPDIRAVLYDFDGTLADSTELIMRCYRHTMAAHLGECPPDEAWLAGFGTPLETQIARFARDAKGIGAADFVRFALERAYPCPVERSRR